MSNKDLLELINLLESLSTYIEAHSEVDIESDKMDKIQEVGVLCGDIEQQIMEGIC